MILEEGQKREEITNSGGAGDDEVVWSDWREVNASHSGMILKKDRELIKTPSKIVSGKPMGAGKARIKGTRSRARNSFSHVHQSA